MFLHLGMNVVLPLWAEPSPAALPVGQFCCAKGAGSRQLHKRGGRRGHRALANSLLGAAHLCNRPMGRKEWRGGPASTWLLAWHCSHLNGTRGCKHKRYVFWGGKEVPREKAPCSLLLFQKDCYWALTVRVEGGHVWGPDLRNKFQPWCNDKAWDSASLQTLSFRPVVKVSSLQRCKALLLQAL